LHSYVSQPNLSFPPPPLRKVTFAPILNTAPFLSPFFPPHPMCRFPLFRIPTLQGYCIARPALCCSHPAPAARQWPFPPPTSSSAQKTPPGSPVCPTVPALAFPPAELLRVCPSLLLNAYRRLKPVSRSSLVDRSSPRYPSKDSSVDNPPPQKGDPPFCITVTFSLLHTWPTSFLFFFPFPLP